MPDQQFDGSMIDGTQLSIIHRKMHGMSFYNWLLMPAIIVLLAITIFPFFWMIVMSLFEISSRPSEPNKFVWFSNYMHLFNDPMFIRAWWIQIKYVVIALSLEFLLGFALALFLNNMKRGQNVITTIFLFPMMIAPVAVGFLYLYLFNSSFGWYYWLLRSVGLLGGGSILGDPSWALAAIIIADVWEWTPFMALVFLAGLKKVPLDQLEASKVDGATPYRQFVDVILPNMKPIIVIAVLIRFMDIMRYIDKIYVMTTGGPAGATRTVSWYLFDTSFRFFELGRGAAHGFILLIVIILLAKYFVGAMRKKGEEA